MQAKGVACNNKRQRRAAIVIEALELIVRLLERERHAATIDAVEEYAARPRVCEDVELEVRQGMRP